MTDMATEVAPTGADTLNAGATSGVEGSGTQGSANPFEGLDETLVGALQKMGVKDLPSLAKAATEKETFIQKSVRYPGEDDPEKLQAFFDKVRPEGPDKYTMPTDIPEGVPYDEGLATAFAGYAHKHGLSDSQFQGLMGDLMQDEAVTGLESKVAENQAQRLNEQANTAATTIAEEFGGKDSEQYNEAVSKVSALTQQTPAVLDELKELGLIDKSDGAILNASVFKLLHALSGEAQVQADGKIDAQPSSDGDVGIDPATGLITNVTKANELFQSDPERYRQMTALAKK